MFLFVRTFGPKFLFSSLVLLLSSLVLITPVAAQSTYTAQLSGVVTDSSGAVIPGAKVTLTDEATGVGTTYTTDGRGIYVFTSVRPARYTIRVQAPNMATQERRGVTLAVSQEATLNFTLSPGVVAETITVTEQVPLLDTGNASLGTDVTSEYFRDMPLINRSMFGLVFLAGGVTETTGSGTQDSYPSGTNFVSNGQRNATAEVRLDGALTSAPEQGEGGTTNVYYQPSVEIVQEFKVENNSFSAEYGNNGGTVVNLVLKEG
jgi:Carboxypeptidase regulatory-like domain